MRTNSRCLIIAALLFALLPGWALETCARPLGIAATASKRTVQQVLEAYGAESQKRLMPFFEAAKAPYPPKKIALLAIKDEKRLELWTEEGEDRFFIRSYPVKAASGVTGPKLREGDLQVPEGIYRLEYLNPESSYHLSMKINYPNDFDRAQARKENRTRLGGDIFIHGKAVSIGCLAMGDRAIEELFTLVAKVGADKVKVIIAPSDPRRGDILSLAHNQPDWVTELYSNIATAMKPYSLADESISAQGNTGSFMKQCH